MNVGLELAKVCEEFICILEVLKTNDLITEEEFILHSKIKEKFIEEKSSLES
ncbi:hypothetical protein KQI41_04300 [Tissierella pigra]|uniref:hypothetical protein n=1 Tax=Tissierella pigra TaxID=2607614 RepID=UPI0012B2F3BB|nr:hypothetical protein [Tissierella pigra]MBU5425627.1 hypothetical protein [Tissierella pigra]